MSKNRIEQDAFDEKNLKQLQRLLATFKDPVRGTVYHYTSAEGFRGIVANSEIWLTNTAFVNDTTECRMFWDLKKEDVFGTGPFQNRLVEAYWDDWAEIRCKQRDSTYYIASFSSRENQLQQYRAYGGFCIGFEATALQARGFDLYRCVYTTKQINEWIRKKSESERWTDVCERDAKNAARDLMNAASIKYKSEHYRREYEVRLFCKSQHVWERWPKTPLMYEREPPIHSRDHMVYRIPVLYVKFFTAIEEAKGDLPWAECTPTETGREMKDRRLKEEDRASRGLLPITKIWIGPMAHQDEAKLACEIMLQEKGYENVPVIASDIPYRGA